MFVDRPVPRYVGVFHEAEGKVGVAVLSCAVAESSSAEIIAVKELGAAANIEVARARSHEEKFSRLAAEAIAKEACLMQHIEL